MSGGKSSTAALDEEQRPIRDLIVLIKTLTSKKKKKFTATDVHVRGMRPPHDHDLD